MKVLDLDKFVPEPKSLKLGGREFDITLIPFEITLRMYEILPVMEKMEKAQTISVEDYNRIFTVIYEALKFSDAELDEKWLRKQINSKRFNELVPFIFSAIFDDGKKNSAEGDDLPTSTLGESSASSVENTDGQPIIS